MMVPSERPAEIIDRRKLRTGGGGGRGANADVSLRIDKPLDRWLHKRLSRMVPKDGDQAAADEAVADLAAEIRYVIQSVADWIAKERRVKAVSREAKRRFESGFVPDEKRGTRVKPTRVQCEGLKKMMETKPC